MDYDDGIISDDAQLERAREDIADNLGQYADGWSSIEGGIVTKWVVLAELVTPDGQKAFMEVRSDQLVSWERAGLLYHALKEDT